MRPRPVPMTRSVSEMTGNQGMDDIPAPGDNDAEVVAALTGTAV
jgi:hypothetical protein